MSQQAPLIHDGRGGIWRRYLLPDSRAINAAPWMDSLSRREPVGTCQCGGYLFGGQPYTPLGATRQWYPAACSTVGCGYEVAAAGPKPNKRPRRSNR